MEITLPRASKHCQNGLNEDHNNSTLAVLDNVNSSLLFPPKQFSQQGREMWKEELRDKSSVQGKENKDDPWVATFHLLMVVVSLVLSPVLVVCLAWTLSCV